MINIIQYLETERDWSKNQSPFQFKVSKRFMLSI